MVLQVLLSAALLNPSVAPFAIHKNVVSRTRSVSCDTIQSYGRVRFNVNVHLSSTVTDNDNEDGASSTSTSSTVLPEPSSMRVHDIKEELKAMGVSSSDCFDKDSLCERLVDARSGKVKGTPKPTPSASAAETATATSASTSTAATFDTEAVLADLRSKKVRELRTQCAQNNIPWATFIEKEELVRALLEYKKKACNFSPSGKISPGQVATIDDETLTKEVAPGAATTPLLLDVYATWCGPCKMMAPYLEEAASELGDTVRVAKIDSDQFPEWSSRLRVRSLPTIIVFDGKTGQEIERVEGALMKDQLLQLARKHV
jgi:thioredoxin